MFENILLAIVQAATEFLPISSSGHLVFVSKMISKPNLFFFTILHAASLFAVMIFTRTELKRLLNFDGEYARWWIYLIVATLPAALTGFFFKDIIKTTFSSYLFIGPAFIFTGAVLFSTRFRREHNLKINMKSAILIGLLQVLGLFPGISRSGITISTALLLGVEKEKAIKFSFLLFIPLSFGAVLSNCFTKNGVMEGGGFYFNFSSLIASFVVCLVMSLVFLNLMLRIIKKGKIWFFSIYCLAIGLLSLFLHSLSF